MKRVQALFPTLIYSAPLQARGAAAFNAELADECRKIRAFDRAGQRWSRENYPGGYTSYGSMDRLHRFSSTFDQLRQRIDAHVAAFARALQWELRRGAKLEMTDCWVNIMERGAAHGSHLHPQAVISGTYYVQVPTQSPGLKFEDPRLAQMMAAPPRRASAPIAQRAHVTYPAKAGQVLLFESWLRHEVPSHRARGERISISFNYHHA
ncbi:MAG TPA: TIGR02466 family protein [Nevskiaceae bacterium]|nr:TIGR02466 family protein [Nevskiaceae bacterium]